MPYSYSRIRASDGLLSSNNNISSSYDTNGNVRVELSPTPRQRNSFTSREPLKLTSSTINRSHTFSKAEKPSHMIRSDTFILKHHSDDYSDEHTMPTIIDYGTYTRSRSKSKSRANNNYSSDEKSRQHSDDKSNYATYTRPPPKDKHYANVDGYRKSSRSQHRDEQRHHRSYRSHSHDSTDRNHHHISSNNNTATLTRRAKPKRVESFIKKFDTINFWKRRDSKDKSPSPATNNNNNSNNTTNGSSSVGGDTLKRTKNIFNLIASSKKSTRDIGIECKLDQEERQERYDHFDSSYSHQYGSNGGGGVVVGNDMGLRKSSVQSLNEELPKYRRAMSKPKVYEHGSTQLLTSIIKTPERRYAAAAVPTTRVGFDVKSRSKYTPSPPIDTYDDTRARRPVGVASPQPQIRSRSVLKNGNSTLKKQAPLPPSTPPYSSTLKSTRLLASIENGNNLHDNDLTRQESDRMSFREYRERLLKAKNENNRRLLAENSDDELRKSHQQSFFVPI